MVKGIQDDIYARGKQVHTFPKVTIGGYPASDDAQNQDSLTKALCKRGVAAAC